MTTGPAPSLVLLGSPHLQRGQARVDLPDKLPGYLVAFLATRADWVLREELAVLLWPQASEAEAQNNLRVNLARLRPHLAAWGLPEAFVAERRRLRLDLASDVAALRAAHAGGDWARAAATAGAPFLDGLSFRAFAVLGEWARGERESLRHLWRDALLRAAQGAPPRTRLDLAARYLQADPFDEEAMRLQLDALAELGRGAEAQRVYTEFDARVRGELGVGASRALADHARRIAPGVSVGTAGSPAGDDDALIGREAELDELAQALRRTRLVVVVGLGGSGKTRLARAAQSRLSRAFDTSLWLAPDDTGSVDGLVHRVADGLRCTLPAGTDAAAALAAHIGEQSLLLLVDSAEQLLVDPEALQRLLGRLLDACPGLGIVVTSREPLGQPRAALLRLGGLAMPAPEAGRATLAADAVRLFVHEAQRVRAGFDPRSVTAELAAIARSTGGLPLALRIAAGWMRFLSCADVAAAFPREFAHQDASDGDAAGLRAMLSYSWQRMSVPERDALAQLSVFATAFSAQAAGDVAHAAVPVLGSLVDRCLLLPLPPATPGDDDRQRFELHALVRQFAAGELARDWSRQQAARARHADHVRHALDRAAALRKRDAGAALVHIGHLLPECRLAWTWAVDNAQPAFLAETAPLLASYFEVKGRYGEGAAWMAQAQQALDPKRRADLTALAATGVARGRLLYRLGEPATAEQLVRQALDFARAVDHHGHLIDGLVALGMIASRRAAYAEEIACYRQARAIALDDGTDERAAAIAGRIALPLARMGELAEAEAMWRESLAAERASGRWLAAAQTASNLARLLLEARRFDDAQPLLEEALRLCDEHGFASVRSPVLVNLAQLHFEAGRGAAALSLGELALAEALRSGEKRAGTAARLVLAEVLLAGPAMDRALPYARDALVHAHLSSDRQNVFGALDVFAQWCARRGNVAHAALVWQVVIDGPGASQGVRDASNAHRRAAALAPAVLDAAREQAAHMDLTALVELALADYAQVIG